MRKLERKRGQIPFSLELPMRGHPIRKRYLTPFPPFPPSEMVVCPRFPFRSTVGLEELVRLRLRGLEGLGRRLLAGERGLDRVVEELPHAAGLEGRKLGRRVLELVARDDRRRKGHRVFLELRRLVGVGTRRDVARGDAPVRGALGR